MRFIKEANSLTSRLADEIESDNEVRLIDAFVEKTDLGSHGFIYKTDNKGKIDKGGPSEYHPRALLKLYIYGYLNRIRSSRQLAKQCRINIEVIWLKGFEKVSSEFALIFSAYNFRRVADGQSYLF